MAEHARAATRAVSHTQYLTFQVSGVELGVSLQSISEIVPYERVSPIPGTPAMVRGVVHLRGQMVPVMDAAARLGLIAEPPGPRSCIVMLDLRRADGSVGLYGLAVDRVATLLDVDSSQVKRAPDFGSGVDVRYLEGLYYAENRVLPLVSVMALFSQAELTYASGILPLAAEVS